jgi:N-acetylmuramoyl-L-alanine amidase
MISVKSSTVFLAAVLAASLAAAPAKAASVPVNGITLETYPNSLRLVIKTESSVPFKDYDLIDAKGLFYIDLYNVHCRINKSKVQRNGPFLREYEFAVFPETQVLRIILHPQPGVRCRTFRGESPARTVVEFTRASSGQAAPHSPSAARPDPEPLADGPSRRWKVIIDPGHGGKDPGAESRVKVNGKQVQEKDLALSISLRLAGMIEKSGNMDYAMTRSDDRYVKLYERVQIAKQVAEPNDARYIFVSIHCNSEEKGSKARGFEIYFLDDSKKAAESEVARLENNPWYKEELKGNSKLRDLFESLQRDKLEERKRQSEKLCKYVDYVANQEPYFKKYNRHYKKDHFYVLKNPYMPSVLVEAGFLSNTDECKKLLTPDFQYNVAALVFNGINHFISDQDPSFHGCQFPFR